jgi:site-specific recombinase XerD
LGRAGQAVAGRGAADASFRHAAATYLLAGGAQLAQVQQLPGHSQVGLTANLYGHVVPGASDAIVQELADALDPSQRGLLIN